MRKRRKKTPSHRVEIRQGRNDGKEEPGRQRSVRLDNDRPASARNNLKATEKTDLSRLAKIKRIWMIMNATNRACLDETFLSPFVLSDEHLDAIFKIIEHYEQTYLDDPRFHYKGIGDDD